MSSKQTHHDTNQGIDTVTQRPKLKHDGESMSAVKATPYHPRRAALVCCIIPGETDDGGLATRMPVFGLTMGMAAAFLADG